MTNLHILSNPVSDVWKCPKKVVFFLFFFAFFTTFFDTFGLIGSVKTFSKVLGVGMNVGPYMAYILYKKVFFYPLYKKRGFGGPKKFHHKFLAFFGHFGHQNG